MSAMLTHAGNLKFRIRQRLDKAVSAIAARSDYARAEVYCQQAMDDFARLDGLREQEQSEHKTIRKRTRL